MNRNCKVAVCSRSFSRNQELRSQLLGRYEFVKFNDEGLVLSDEKLVNFLRGCNKAIVGLEVINGQVLAQLPELEIVSKYGVGLDMIDLHAMGQYKKRLGWTAGVNRRSVSELVIAFSIMMLRHLALANREIKDGRWSQLVGTQLTDKTVGIIGCGHVGKDLTQLLKPYNCKILANDIVDNSEFYHSNGIKSASLEDLLKESDIVTLHVPLTKDTEFILNAERLNMLKPSAILINTARGRLVDELALKKMLIEKKIKAAAFDVFTEEPPKDVDLINIPNFFSTPHIGGSANEAILAMGMAAIYGLEENYPPTEFGIIFPK